MSFICSSERSPLISMTFILQAKPFTMDIFDLGTLSTSDKNSKTLEFAFWSTGEALTLMHAVFVISDHSIDSRLEFGLIQAVICVALEIFDFFIKAVV